MIVHLKHKYGTGHLLPSSFMIHLSWPWVFICCGFLFDFNGSPYLWRIH